MKAKQHDKRKTKPTRPHARKRGDETDDRYIREQVAAIEYTKLWHQTRDDAAKLLACISGRTVTFPRQRGSMYTEIVRTALISSPSNSDAAYRKGWSPEMLQDQLSGCASVAQSGVRRVLVRALAWLIDDEDEIAYDPQWFTLIHKVSPDAQNLPQAIANALMWVDRYLTEIEFQVASKLLRFTKMEVVFWTQGPDARLL